MSVPDAAAKMGIAPAMLDAIIDAREQVTGSTADCFAAFTGMSAQFWINLQTGYDEWRATRGIFRITYEVEDDGAVSAWVPGIPVYAQGKTRDDAERAITELLDAYKKAHPQSNETVP